MSKNQANMDQVKFVKTLRLKHKQANISVIQTNCECCSDKLQTCRPGELYSG